MVFVDITSAASAEAAIPIADTNAAVKSQFGKAHVCFISPIEKPVSVAPGTTGFNDRPEWSVWEYMVHAQSSRLAEFGGRGCPSIFAAERLAAWQCSPR
jgi:hypothetical protein